MQAALALHSASVSISPSSCAGMQTVSMGTSTFPLPAPQEPGSGLCGCVGTTARDRNRRAPSQYSLGFFSCPILVNQVLKMEILKIPGAVNISSLIRLTSYLTWLQELKVSAQLSAWLDTHIFLSEQTTLSS